MHIHFTVSSTNSKTGPMLVTTQSSDTCSDSCPFNGAGCYGQAGGHLLWHWRKVSNGERTKKWEDFLAAIKKQQKGSLWRMSQVGDLPHTDEEIDLDKLQDVIDANRHMKGFTFTHHNTESEHNRKAIEHANDNGFTINLSANNLKDADQKAALNIGPVAVPIPEDPANWPKTTPEGRPIVPCLNPRHGLTCAECGLCAVAKRKSIVGFPAHGSGKRKIEKVISA